MQLASRFCQRWLSSNRTTAAVDHPETRSADSPSVFVAEVAPPTQRHKAGLTLNLGWPVADVTAKEFVVTAQLERIREFRGRGSVQRLPEAARTTGSESRRTERSDHVFSRFTLAGQRHFQVPYKHEAQASEQLAAKLTRLRFVLVFSCIRTKVALSN